MLMAPGCLGPGCCTLCCCACRRWKTTFLCYLSCLCAVSPWTHQSLDQGWSSDGVWASPSLQAHIHGPYVLRWKLSLRRACLYLPANDEIRWENALLVLAFYKVWQRHRDGVLLYIHVSIWALWGQSKNSARNTTKPLCSISFAPFWSCTMFACGEQPQDTRTAWRPTRCESSRNAQLTDSCSYYLITLPAQGPYEKQYQAATENVQQDSLNKMWTSEINPCETKQLITMQAHATPLIPGSPVPSGYWHRKGF